MENNALKTAAARVGYGLLASWWLLGGPAFLILGLTDKSMELPALIAALILTGALYVIGVVLWYRRGFVVIKNAIRDFLLLMRFALPGYLVVGIFRGLTRSDAFRSNEWLISFIFPFLGFWWLERRKQTRYLLTTNPSQPNTLIQK